MGDSGVDLWAVRGKASWGKGLMAARSAAETPSKSIQRPYLAWKDDQYSAKVLTLRNQDACTPLFLE